ncbi:MAG: HD-GYP domain-containing protein [Candidatus Villigracilaceae bacterium]
MQQNDIPLMALIFAVVDFFDALTTHRPYRRKVSAEKALAYLKNQAGILFDPQIVTTFTKLIEEKKLEDLLTDT